MLLILLALTIGFVTAKLHNNGYTKTGNCLFGGTIFAVWAWVAYNIFIVIYP